MIISQEHRYLFVEVPHTASTAISKELRELYAGRAILVKHARYNDFLRTATADEARYFTFAGIRHPMDDVVSMYSKLLTNHRGDYDNSANYTDNGGWVTRDMRDRFAFIQSHPGDFPAYFRRFYPQVYVNRFYFNARDYDFLVRFEYLQADFSTLLGRMGVTQRRPLPSVNPTSGKNGSFETYYTPEIRAQAVRVFGPFMRHWGYHFPTDWGRTAVPLGSRLEYACLRRLGAAAVSRFRASPRTTGKVISGVRRVFRSPRVAA